MRTLLTVTLFLAAGPALAADDKKEPPPVKEHVYKTTNGVELKLFVHYPEGWQASDKRPAVVFFFGGGWTNGSTQQFRPQAEYFASRGMVAARADYRVKSKHNVTPDQCVEDAKSAVRWMRQNAGKLGIDPQRIAAAGGSAGGHLAIAAFTAPGLDAMGEDAKVSCRPNLLLLYNPALLGPTQFQERVKSAEVAKQIAPNENLSKEVPPTILFFGTKDRLIDGAEEFLKKARPLGIQAELYTAADMAHGFFNRSPWQERTTYQTDLFLTKHGWLKGEPTVKPSADAMLKLAGRSPE
jgi:acetyl esterase/lipase